MFIKIATNEKSSDRMEICKKCDKLSKLKFCKACGCFMPLKTRLENASCPLDKWGNIFNSWS